MDTFLFEDENESSQEAIDVNAQCWRILVVDDDESVHQVTKLVLSGLVIEGRSLELVSVFSKQQAQELLAQDQDFCIAFVDVVMESDHAGLELIEWIRNDLKNQAIRLVLRTGQAGTAPEAKVIKEFDINDYKEKTDFTSNKMITTLYAGIRAYRDIMTIQRSLDAFKSLITTTHHLLRIDQIRSFGSAVLNQLLTLMDIQSSALYIARNQLDFNQQEHNSIIACTGRYVSDAENLASSSIDNNVKQKITQAFEQKQHQSSDKCFIGYYETSANTASVLYIEIENTSHYFNSNLLEFFATNVALIFEGLTRQYQIEVTQKDLLFIVGEAIEARTKESGAHVRRVALICELLARKLNLDEHYIDAIKVSAPLHDIGKITIPETILTKPAELDEQEWQIIKNHTVSGAELLSKSQSSIATLAARLARYHHENWDGSGYPEGLSGEQIPVEARIMAVADVFDALGIKRVYKEAWHENDIKQFMIEERGKKFEPRLIDILIDNFDEFVQIRRDFPDL